MKLQIGFWVVQKSLDGQQEERLFGKSIEQWLVLISTREFGECKKRKEEAEFVFWSVL